jgi:hypothetical protein
MVFYVRTIDPRVVVAQVVVYLNEEAGLDKITFVDDEVLTIDLRRIRDM